MPGVRNGCVARGQVLGNGAPVVVYTVPAGHAFLLKSVVLNNLAAGTWTYNAALRSGDHQTQVYILSTPATDVPLQNEMWLPMNPGDELILTSVGPSMAYWIGGAELPGTPFVD